MLSGRSRLFSAAFVAAASWGTMASADGAKPDKLECIAADTDGQSLRMAGKLLGARKRLAVCASAVCPSIVRDDCVQRITEIEAAQPTVVFTATNGYGRSLVAVRVTVDGAPLTDRLDGRPLRVDPGEHEFAFEALGRMHARVTLALHEGEQNERHAVVLHTESADAAVLPAPAEPAGPSESDLVVSLPASRPLASPTARAPVAQQDVPAPAVAVHQTSVLDSDARKAAIAAAGLGVIAVAVGSIFGLLTVSEWSDAQRDCGRACSVDALGRQEEGTASRYGSISTFAFVAGGVGLAAGAFLWFTAPDSSRAPTAVRVLPSVGADEGQLVVQGRF